MVSIFYLSGDLQNISAHAKLTYPMNMHVRLWHRIPQHEHFSRGLFSLGLSF